MACGCCFLWAIIRLCLYFTFDYFDHSYNVDAINRHLFSFSYIHNKSFMIYEGLDRGVGGGGSDIH